MCKSEISKKKKPLVGNKDWDGLPSHRLKYRNLRADDERKRAEVEQLARTELSKMRLQRLRKLTPLTPQREREIANLNVRPTPPTPQNQITGDAKPENVVMDCKKYCHGCAQEDMELGFRCKKCEGTEGAILTGDGIPLGKGYCIGDGENGVCYDYDNILKWVRMTTKNPKTRRRLTTQQIRAQWAKGNKCEDSKSSREVQAQHRLWQSQLAPEPVSSSSSAPRWTVFQEGPGPNRRYSWPAVRRRRQERRRIKEQREEFNSIERQRKKEIKAREKERKKEIKAREKERKKEIEEEQALHRLGQSQLDAEPVSSSSSAADLSLFQEGPGPNRKYSGAAVIQRLQDRRKIKEQREEINSIERQRKKEIKAREKERKKEIEEEQALHRLGQSQLDAEPVSSSSSSSSSAADLSLFQEGPGPNRKYSGAAVIQRLQERRRIKEQREEFNSIKKQRKKEIKARKKEREPFFESKEPPAFCRNCGKKDPLWTKYDNLCKKCGFDQRILLVPPNFCPSCRDPNGVHFCGMCGNDYSATYKRRRKS